MSNVEVPPADAIVEDGNARFQVLTETLVRLEYASDGTFEDRASFFAVDRSFDPPSFERRVADGWLVIDTGELVLRYDRGSGPFTEDNVEVELAGEDAAADAPSWNGRICTAGEASGDATIATDREGHTGDDYLLLDADADASWTVTEPPAEDEYGFRLRYAADAATTATVTVDGETAGTVDLDATDGWATAEVSLELDETGHDVGVRVDGEAALDCCAVTGVGAGPAGTEDANLGGWYRDLDAQSGEVDMFDGLLSRDGYYLLDDSETAVWTADDWTEARDRADVYRDGYLFAYGSDYERALREFRDLTGPAPLLPRWTFGNWFSRYYPYSASDYREDLIPSFREADVPLSVLVIDTDWKAPKIPGVKGAGASWSAWNWDTDLFPDPEGFMDWVDDQGLHTVMNVHPSIYERDPKYPRADEIAGGLEEGFFVGPDYATAYVWDWADPDHAESYMWLHEEFDEMGNELWWLDWIADGSEVSTPGLTGDSWINHLYAEHRREHHGRGFAFSRIGADVTNDGLNSTGPWAEHRSTLHFTGDTGPTWEMLDFQTYFTVQEGSIGIPYVTHDIGSHTGGRLPGELYVRWVQSGTFQPILRLHSVPGGLRLPWQYEGEAGDVAADFLRLRHELVPYLYTVAREAHDTGLPMCRGTYLDYPDHEAAYEYDRQYLLGDDVLVAPVGEPAEGDPRDAESTFAFDERCEAEEADIGEGAYPNTFYSGFSGRSYVDGWTNEDASVTVPVEDVPADGRYDVVVRYANHVSEGGEEPTPTTMGLAVGGERVETLTFEPTESWHDWATERTRVELTAGTNEVAVERGPDDEGDLNVDFLAVVEPGDPVPERPPPEPIADATTEVWFPPGEWVDFFTGERFEGPGAETVTVPIDQMPVFVRAGGVVPMQDHDESGPAPDPVRIRAFPGGDGSVDLYEDAGEGPGHRDGAFTWTPIDQERGDGGATVTVGPADGDYPDAPDERGYRIEFVDADRPDAVTVDGERVPERDPEADGEGWHHDGDALHVRVAARPVDEQTTVAVR
ncbi:MAG: TIM-barrel domain-containing protein [Halobacteriaceae archaeon]